MRGHSGVDDDVVFSRILVHWESAKNKEALTYMQLFGQVPENGVQIGQREG